MIAAEDGRALRARPPWHLLAIVGLPAIPIVFAAIVYRGVPDTYFFADDFVHMVDIVNVGFLRFVFQPFGGHVIVLPDVLFFVTYHLFGFDPRPYYWIGFLTHLLNVWLVYRVVRGMTNGNAVLGCLGAALWGASPLMRDTVGWFSVWGQELSATVLLLLLDGAVRVARDAQPSLLRVVGWCGLMLAGMASFGTGIGIAMVSPAVVFLLVPATFARPRLRLVLLAFPILVAGLYWAFRHIYPYFFAPLPLSEAILENMVFSELSPIPIMFWHLIAFAITGLCMNFTLVPTSYPVATPTWLVPAFLVAFGLAFGVGDATVRRRLLALAILCIATYAAIAVGRSNVYRAFKVEPYAAARVGRYHYVGSLPLTIALCVMLDQIVRRAWPVAPVVLVVWLAFTVRGYRHSTFRLEDRTAIRRWVLVAENRIDDAVDAVPPGGTVSIENDEAPPYVLGPALGKTEFPGLAGVFVLTHAGDDVRGRRVRFIERHIGVLNKTRDPAGNQRLATLLVTAQAVAQAPAAH